jgi:hypothetical protein
MGFDGFLPILPFLFECVNRHLQNSIISRIHPFGYSSSCSVQTGEQVTVGDSAASVLQRGLKIMSISKNCKNKITRLFQNIRSQLHATSHLNLNKTLSDR